MTFAGIFCCGMKYSKVKQLHEKLIAKVTDGTAKIEHFEKLHLIKKYLPNITISKQKRDDIEEKTKVPSKKSNTGAVLDSSASRAAASTLLDLTAAQKL